MYFIFDTYNIIKNKLKSLFFPADPTPAHLREWPFPVGHVPATKPKRGRPRKNADTNKKAQSKPKRTAITVPKKAK